MKKLKIAVWHNLASGGGKRALYYHIKGLLGRGHNVESWCPPTADQTYLPLSRMVKENIIPLPLKSRAETNPIYRRLTKPYHRIIDQIEAMNWHCKRCADQINNGGYDLLFANACIFFGASPIGRFVNIPKAIYLGEPFRKLYEAMPQLPWIALPESKRFWGIENIKMRLKDYFRIRALRLQAREEFINARAFDLILVNSHFSRESMLRAYGLESQVCYLGIDTALFRDIGAPRENFVVGLGSITPGKRPDRAIRAIGTIDKSIRPDLVWIGNLRDGKYEEQMHELAKSLEVKFITKHRLEDEDLVEYLNRSRVMLYTSQLEPFGFAPLEANACGTPVVAIAEGGVRESLKNGISGIIIDDDNSVTIGNAIVRFLKEPDFAREIGMAARKYVYDDWDWEVAIDRLENYLISLKEGALGVS